MRDRERFAEPTCNLVAFLPIIDPIDPVRTEPADCGQDRFARHCPYHAIDLELRAFGVVMRHVDTDRVGGSAVQAPQRVLAHAIESGFPHWKPLGERTPEIACSVILPVLFFLRAFGRAVCVVVKYGIASQRGLDPFDLGDRFVVADSDHEVLYPSDGPVIRALDVVIDASLFEDLDRGLEVGSV